MKRTHHSAEQIVSVLRQTELGMSVADIIQQLGISEQKLALRQRLRELAQVHPRWGEHCRLSIPVWWNGCSPFRMAHSELSRPRA